MMDDRAIPVWIAQLPDQVRRSRGCRHGHGQWYLAPTEVAMSCEDGLLKQHRVPMELCEPGVALIVGIALLAPYFTHDELIRLTPSERAQRNFWSRMSGGASNANHEYFIRNVKFLSLPSPYPLPTKEGARP